MQKRSDDCSVHQHCGEIVCQACGRTGTIVWDDVTRRGGCDQELAGLDGPFYERLSRQTPYPIELVCRACGCVALTAHPSTSLHARDAYN